MMRPMNVILFFLPLFGCEEDTSMQMADWVLTNGQIYTVDGGRMAKLPLP